MYFLYIPNFRGGHNVVVNVLEYTESHGYLHVAFKNDVNLVGNDELFQLWYDLAIGDMADKTSVYNNCR